MFEDENITFAVVTNHEEQYSIWPDFKEIPDGWIRVGATGSKDECLDYIEEIWTDMRPKSLRDQMRERGDDDESEAVDDLCEHIEGILSDHEERIAEYSDGRPELYGWFFARVFDAIEEDLEPETIRAALNAALPNHQIPEEYA
ncbi:MAG: MbtH family protein [Bradymonadaceae bacterium]